MVGGPPTINGCNQGKAWSHVHAMSIIIHWPPGPFPTKQRSEQLDKFYYVLCLSTEYNVNIKLIHIYSHFGLCGCGCFCLSHSQLLLIFQGGFTATSLEQSRVKPWNQIVTGQEKGNIPTDITRTVDASTEDLGWELVII